MFLFYLLSNSLGKFVSIRGVVVRVSSSQCLVIRLAFECSTCRHIFGVTCENGKYTEPERCRTVGCTNRSFIQQRSHPLTTIIDWQTIRYRFREKIFNKIILI